MIVVSQKLEDRLDRAWYRLQIAIEAQFPNSISQFDADLKKIEAIEQLATQLQGK